MARRRRQPSKAAEPEPGGVMGQQLSCLPTFFHVQAPFSAHVFDSNPSAPCACCQQIPTNCPSFNKKFKHSWSHRVRF